MNKPVSSIFPFVAAATLATTVTILYTTGAEDILHRIAISGLVGMLLLCIAAFSRPRIQTPLFFLILLLSLSFRWPDLQIESWNYCYSWITHWGFAPTNNPQYLIVAAFVIILPFSPALLSPGFRTFDRILISFMLYATVLTVCMFHFIVIHKGYIVELEQRQAENIGVLKLDLTNPINVFKYCDSRGLTCTMANTADSDFSKYVRFQNNGVRKIITDTIDKQNVSFSWQEMEQIDLRALGDPTTLFFKKTGNIILVANDLTGSSIAGKRYFFILYTLISCFTWSWIILFSILKAFHEKRFYSTIDHKEQLYKIFEAS